MIFISKMIYDPRHKMPNLLGLTIGLTFHTPKYWDCKKYDFYVSQFDTMRDELTQEEMERRYQAKKKHANCMRKHLSDKGYMYWTGPKRRYQIHYMGNINPHNKQLKWWGRISEHGRYVRWFDNGPQNPPREPLDDELRALLSVENTRFKDALDRSRQQMIEYERMREG